MKKMYMINIDYDEEYFYSIMCITFLNVLLLLSEFPKLPKSY